MWRLSARWNKLAPIVATGAALAALALFCGGCAPAQTVDALRRDYVAQSLVRRAYQRREGTEAQRQQAARWAERAVQLHPRSVPVLRAAAAVLMEVRAWEAALEILEILRAEGRADLYGLGACRLYTRDRARGTELLEAYLAGEYSLRATGALSDLHLAVALNNVGYVYADNGHNLRRALALTREAVEMFPTNPVFLDSLAWAHFRLGDSDRAAFYVERALRLSRGQPDPEILLHAGIVHADQGRKQLARAELIRVLDLRPGCPQALYHLQRLRWVLPAPQPA